MKLDTKHLRYLTIEDWRVLTAVEVGSKNHEIVPTPLIVQLASLRSGSGVHKSISTLAKANLIGRTKNAKYDGYRLTYGGFDYLALHTHLKRNTLHSLGTCIGTGKESDIYLCRPPSSTSSHDQYVLKVHRLGRTSFRTVKRNRDYLRHRHSASWMYMSRLAAQKEYSLMRALHENGFRVPQPIAWNRHSVIMSLIDGVPLRSVGELGDPAALYEELMGMILKLAAVGIIHGDFNEFNIIVEQRPSEAERSQESLEKAQEGTINAERNGGHEVVIPWMIDFPQAISVDHVNAEFYFDRDVQCIKSFFERRFDFKSSESGPSFQDAEKALASGIKASLKRLDVAVEAAGFSRKMAKELEDYIHSSARGHDVSDQHSEGSLPSSDEDSVTDEV